MAEGVQQGPVLVGTFLTVVVRSVAGVRPGRGRGSNPPWGWVGVQPAGGGAPHVVWHAGIPGCCGSGWCRLCRCPCVDACGVARGSLCVGVGLG